MQLILQTLLDNAVVHACQQSDRADYYPICGFVQAAKGLYGFSKVGRGCRCSYAAYDDVFWLLLILPSITRVVCHLIGGRPHKPLLMTVYEVTFCVSGRGQMV